MSESDAFQADREAEVPPQPTQEEVDALAQFVEAVAELRLPPFFIEETSTLSISMEGNATRHEVTAQLPDPNVMRGVLIP